MESSLFHEIYQICTGQHDGAFIPSFAARLIAERSGLDVETVENELTAPTVYPYDDVYPALDRLLRLPNTVPVIWTEGELATEANETGYQIHKVGASGLLDRYPMWRPRAERLGLPPVIGGFAKVDALKSIQPLFEGGSIQQTLVVDDSLAQLAAAAELLSSFSVRHRLLHIDRSKGPFPTLPPGIARIHRLTDLHDYLAPQGIQLILLDLDYTLIDHARTRREMAERIARLCAAGRAED